MAAQHTPKEAPKNPKKGSDMIAQSTSLTSYLDTSPLSRPQPDALNLERVTGEAVMALVLADPKDTIPELLQAQQNLKNAGIDLIFVVFDETTRERLASASFSFLVKRNRGGSFAGIMAARLQLAKHGGRVIVIESCKDLLDGQTLPKLLLATHSRDTVAAQLNRNNLGSIYCFRAIPLLSMLADLSLSESKNLGLAGLFDHFDRRGWSVARIVVQPEDEALTFISYATPLKSPHHLTTQASV